MYSVFYGILILPTFGILIYIFYIWHFNTYIIAFVNSKLSSSHLKPVPFKGIGSLGKRLGPRGLIRRARHFVYYHIFIKKTFF